MTKEPATDELAKELADLEREFAKSETHLHRAYMDNKAANRKLYKARIAAIRKRLQKSLKEAEAEA